jgi:hypothetical protein
MSGDRLTPELWARQQQFIDEGYGDLGDACLMDLHARVEALEQRPIPGTAELTADHFVGASKMVATPEPAPVATDEELADCYADAAKVAILNRKDYDKALTPGDVLKAQIRALYDLGRKHGAAPTPQPIPVSERLPGWGDCDAEGMCWIGTWSDIDGEPTFDWAYTSPRDWTWEGIAMIQYWLPHCALPLPQREQP